MRVSVQSECVFASVLWKLDLLWGFGDKVESVRVSVHVLRTVLVRARRSEALSVSRLASTGRAECDT